MEFSNTIASPSAIVDDKDAPHAFTNTDTPGTPDAAPPSYRDASWTPARHARWEYILHLISLVLGTLTLCAFIFDLAKSASYHVGVPIGITVVDTASIAFLVLNNAYSLFYLVTGMQARVVQGDLGRTWPLYLDVLLYVLLASMASTTLSTRSSTGKRCDKNRAVGGCSPSRRALMFVTGMGLVFVSIAAQVRFTFTLHAIAERKKREKAARQESAHSEVDLTCDSVVR